ncbi:hypothetical protein O181_006325 [Austropuccinia psidii MF-1]|uniref:Uncharacterized protein n=1 Tax=Austropuccinia psidii MF-1 TaxID=1389203 RepID=A0A9Q3BK73_9BASI|nr:hypothetical protein [Austropuccinia psidii MF-1]
MFPGKLSDPPNIEADQLQLATDLDQTLIKSSPKVSQHEKEVSPQRNNLEIGSPIPSRSDPESDPTENSTEETTTKTNQPALSRTDPEPDPNPPPKGKIRRYEWIPENEPPPKEILGKVGDPRNIIESRRQCKHSANAFSLLDKECPKNFHQPMKSDLNKHWEDAIQKELESMENTKFSPPFPQKNT